MRTLRGIIQYDGTAYAGFQRQRNASTIQGTLEQAVAAVTGELSPVKGAGRTDAGVHARGQVVSFKTGTALTNKVLLRALNAVLPADIVLSTLEDAASDFDVRRDARSRAYEYVVYNAPLASPFWRRYAYHVSSPLDVPAMAQGLAHLQGEHDFAAFGMPMEYTRDRVTSHGGTVRTMMATRCWATHPFVYVYLEANAFLRHMVRHIVGTILRVGRQRLASSDIVQILASRRLADAGPAAPARGLYLVQVTY